MSKQTSPSEGARKAAKAIRDAYAFDLLPEAEPNIAYLIDEASGLAECVEALTRLADSKNYDGSGWIGDSDPMTIATLALHRIGTTQ